MPKTEPALLQPVRQAAQLLLNEGKTEEAFEYLLSALSSVLDQQRTLELLLAKLRRERAGKTSERVDPAQLLLLFEELMSQAGTDATPEVDPAAESDADAELQSQIEDARRDETAATEKNGAKGKRRQIKTRHRNIKRVEHQVLVPEADRHCDSCGKAKSRIGEDLTRTLEYIPAQFVEHVHHLEKYACRNCKDGVTTAQGPAKILDRSPAGASLLAQVVVAKYADHTPLHRQRKIFSRDGALIGVSTLADWVAGVADLVHPVIEQLARRVLAAYVVGTDATGLKVLDPSLPDLLLPKTLARRGEKAMQRSQAAV